MISDDSILIRENDIGNPRPPTGTSFTEFSFGHWFLIIDALYRIRNRAKEMIVFWQNEFASGNLIVIFYDVENAEEVCEKAD